MRDEIARIQTMMEAADYVTDAPIATSVHLAMVLKKPLLIEGHAGVGKTEVAKVMARVLGTNLIRLQCYEGLDAAMALYEWNYQKQLLHIKIAEGSGTTTAHEEAAIFSEPFLLKRPLLLAITQDTAPVLLVDEVDRCVTGDTLVATTTGIRRAEEIQPGDELLSFDPSAFRPTQARVNTVVPREAALVIRILVGGRFLEVTPEHRFVRYTEDGWEVIEAARLRVGDRLPLYKRCRPQPELEPEFDFPDRMLKLTEPGRRLLHSAYKASGKTYLDLSESAGVSRSHLRNVLQPRPFRKSLRASVLARISASLGTNAMLEPEHSSGLQVMQSVAFYEVLGYIVADGCFTSDRVCIVDKDPANLQIYSTKFREAFGVTPRIVKGPHRNYKLTYHSLPLGRFLRCLLGRGMVHSRKRMIPGFVLSLPSCKRAGFLRGFFDGEGWVAHHQVAAASSSPYLLVGIQQLLSSLGVDSHMSKTGSSPGNFGKGPYYTLSIINVRAFAEAVGFCSPAKRELLGSPPPPAFTRTETLPRTAVVATLRRIVEQHVLNGKPAHQTVYDILSGRVQTNVSSLRRIADTFRSAELRDLLDRDVVLGQVTSVDTVEAPQTVYDFVLDGSPYFVANQVVTHNCDEEFEAFMLEVFSEWQVTIPEIGTIKASHPPYVVLTSNRIRELSDALRRRCLYLWIDYPPFEKEVRIVERKVSGVNARLAREVARFMESLRTVRLSKVPGVAETLDWAQALMSLHADHLDEELVAETLGCVLKDADDIKRFKTEVGTAGLGRFLPSNG